MITKNYINFVKTLICAQQFTTFTTTSGGTENLAPLYSYSSTTKGGFRTDPTIATNKSTINAIVVGDGNIEPTVDDYTLSGNIITGIVGTASYTLVENDGGITLQYDVTITNNNDSEITISEIGYIGLIYRNTSGNGSATLLDRTLLDVPITIEAGGVGQITYTISFNIA